MEKYLKFRKRKGRERQVKGERIGEWSDEKMRETAREAGAMKRKGTGEEK